MIHSLRELARSALRAWNRWRFQRQARRTISRMPKIAALHDVLAVRRRLHKPTKDILALIKRAITDELAKAVQSQRINA